jgi:putative addiction module killer protein
MHYEVTATETFAKWIGKLSDRRARLIIDARLERLKVGNFGDAKALGGGLSELRIAFGPGYRVYFTVEDGRIVVLLAGGDKSSQRRDIAKARDML